MTVSLKIWFRNPLYNLLYWTTTWVLTMKFLSGECYRTSLMRNKHWFRWWLGAIRQQAITLTSVEPDLHHHLTSLGHDELSNMSHWFYWMCMITNTGYDLLIKNISSFIYHTMSIVILCFCGFIFVKHMQSLPYAIINIYKLNLPNYLKLVMLVTMCQDSSS